jgi:hypothetical protein
LRFEEICKNSAFFGLRSLFQQSKGLQQWLNLWQNIAKFLM